MPAPSAPSAPPPLDTCQPGRYARTIVADENAWHAARSFTRRVFGNRAGDLLTVTDELVVNAVRHARGTTSIGLSFQRLPGGVLVEVADGDGSNLPALRNAGDLEGSGRGLALVAGLSARWGWRPRPEGNGKVVFAVVPAEAPAQVLAEGE